MYPAIRMLWQLYQHRKDPALPLTGCHVSHHYCLPWDIDLWMELNNGRTLTLYDLGRIPLARRVGLVNLLRKKRWGLTMAGAVVRYRRRVRTFERIEMRSRAIGWDARFLYLEQSMWLKSGECANHIVYRSAITSAKGIVPPAEALAAMGQEVASPPLPDWVRTWQQAEEQRPWPPMNDQPTQE